MGNWPPLLSPKRLLRSRRRSTSLSKTDRAESEPMISVFYLEVGNEGTSKGLSVTPPQGGWGFVVSSKVKL
jgi:hypothetical protein